MEITWYGHACFRIVTDKGIRIVTDPYDPGFGGLSYGSIPDEADIVTVSHDHGDHNHVDGVPGKPIVVKGAGRHEAKDITFSGVATYHDESGGSERGKNTIFTFDANGLIICHCGDLGHVLTVGEAQSVGPVDVLLIPVGGFYTIGPKEADEVISQLSPKLVIPMHFKTPKCDFPIAPVDEFLEQKSGVERVAGSSYSVSSASVGGGPSTVVLNPAL